MLNKEQSEDDKLSTFFDLWRFVQTLIKIPMPELKTITADSTFPKERVPSKRIFYSKLKVSQWLETKRYIRPQIENTYTPLNQLFPAPIKNSNTESSRINKVIHWIDRNKEFVDRKQKELGAVTRESKRNYQNRKRKEDPLFKLLGILRNRIRGAIKNNSKSARLEDLTDCSIQHLRQHLERQFQTGMSWDNHGQWHIDHIRPCCSFDLSKEEEQKACFHWSNLQPLWATDNLKKNGKWEPAHATRTAPAGSSPCTLGS